MFCPGVTYSQSPPFSAMVGYLVQGGGGGYQKEIDIIEVCGMVVFGVCRQNTPC